MFSLSSEVDNSISFPESSLPLSSDGAANKDLWDKALDKGNEDSGS